MSNEPIIHKPDDLELFVVYEKPSDFPNSFVVRKHTIIMGKAKPAGSPMLIGPNIDHIREVLRQMGAINIGRFPNDDPVIKEVWI